MALTCIIVDDDEASRLMAEQCVKRTPALDLKKSFSSAEDAIKFLEQNSINVIFLDVEMPGMSGIDFLRDYKHNAQIVMITGKKEYAADAFDYNVTDYIVKPIEYTRFLKAVSKLEEMNNAVELDKTDPINSNEIFIKHNSKHVKLNMNDIKWIEALDDYVNIYTTAQRYTILSTMKGMEQKLANKSFCRIHRSFIINLKCVKQIADSTVVLADDKTLPISRSYGNILKSKLNYL